MIVRMTIELEGENDTRQLEALLRGLVNAISVENTAASPAVVSEVTATGKPRQRRARGKNRAKRGEGVISMVKALQNEGYFASRHTASEVRDELISRGHAIDNRQIYATLKYLSDRNVLGREDIDGTYAYYSA